MPFAAWVAPGGPLLLFAFDDEAFGLFARRPARGAVLQAQKRTAPARPFNNLSQISSLTKGDAIVRFAYPLEAKNK